MEKTKKIWMDGKLVNWEEANVHVLTHTLHYGLGVFEGIRCYDTKNGPAVFHLEDHIRRLFNSAKISKINIPFSEAEIVSAVKETIRVNGLKKCYIRPLVFLGSDRLGLNPIGISVHVAIAVWEWGAYLGKDGLENGIRVKVASFTAPAVNSTMLKAKTCGNYVISILAKTEAIENGYEEAILLNSEGYVTQGSGENIFIVRDGILKTPSLVHVLEGITHNSVMSLAKDLKIPVVEASISRDELYIADEVFFTGTAAEITPVREIDRRVIGTGKPGPITKKLQEKFFNIVSGKDKKYKSWLNFIS